MNRKFYVYKITNLINGKIYVGMTGQTIIKRWKTHLKSTNKNLPLYNSIRNYGVNNFVIEQIEEFLSKEEAFYREIKYIKEYNTKMPNGYNLTDGGAGSSK